MLHPIKDNMKPACTCRYDYYCQAVRNLTFVTNFMNILMNVVISLSLLEDTPCSASIAFYPFQKNVRKAKEWHDLLFISQHA